MVDLDTIPSTRIEWPRAARIVRAPSRRVDHFDDIGDPADWPHLVAAERATSPTFAEGVGDYRALPADRHATGRGAHHLMKPFTHVSRDRPIRFSDGSFGVLYAARTFEAALFETVYHHGRFMAATQQTSGWTSQFLEIALDIDASLHDLRNLGRRTNSILDPADHGAGQKLGSELHASGSNGIVYPSVRLVGGECSALFYPRLGRNVRELRYLDYHWDGSRVDLYRELESGEVYRITGG
ncbi:MAG: RES family NAD+ phosphorylase [Gammaproteobacteria bacterium]|nr:RES family NAD+ phosphorylase [Gammaproteobacteria bacterium]